MRKITAKNISTFLLHIKGGFYNWTGDEFHCKSGQQLAKNLIKKLQVAKVDRTAKTEATVNRRNREKKASG